MSDIQSSKETNLVMLSDEVVIAAMHPLEGNEHLIGTTIEADDEIAWEEKNGDLVMTIRKKCRPCTT